MCSTTIQEPCPTICAICLWELCGSNATVLKLSCGHELHESCAKEIQRAVVSDKCPVCRTSHPEELMSVQKMIQMAEECQLLGSWAAMWDWASLARKTDPTCLIAYRMLGTVILNNRRKLTRRDFEVAQHHLKKAHDGGDVGATNNLGLLFERQGDSASAKEWYQKALRNGFAEAGNNLALLCEKTGYEEEAMQSWEEAHSLGLVKATYNLGSSYFRQGMFAKAQEFFEEALIKGGEDLDCITMLATSLLAQGMPGLVKRGRDLLEFYGHKYCCSDAIVNLGTSYLREGNIAKARELFQEAASMEVDGFGQASLRLAFLDKLTKASETERRDMFQKGDANIRQFFFSADLVDSEPFNVGDRVSLRDLTSPSGTELNGLSGTVQILLKSGRIGVKIDGIHEVKSFKAVNLEHMLSDQVPRDFQDHAQGSDLRIPDASLPQSLVSLNEDSTCSSVNAQVSNALLRNCAETCPRVVILKYRRAAAAFKQALDTSEILMEIHSSLRAHSFACVLGKGAHIFVKPEHYVAAMTAIRNKGITLYSSHVVVDDYLVNHVQDILSRVRQGVYLSSSDSVPLGYPFTFNVEKTFINISVPSSLVSSLDAPPRTFPLDKQQQMALASMRFHSVASC